MFKASSMTFLLEYQWDILVLGMFFLILILISWKKSRVSIRKRPTKQGMLGYYIAYADQKQTKGINGQEDFGKILYSAQHDIQGKPDYIFWKKIGRGLVPVEIKSGAIGEDVLPHRGDMLQVAMYFLIIEDVYRIRPKYGKLLYRDYMFTIKNTRRLRKEVLQTIAQMRKMLQDGKGQANSGFAHCRYCLCKGTVCEFCE